MFVKFIESLLLKFVVYKIFISIIYYNCCIIPILWLWNLIFNKLLIFIEISTVRNKSYLETVHTIYGMNFQKQINYKLNIHILILDLTLFF